MSIDFSTRFKADEAFSQARRRAFLQRVWRLFTGRAPATLLSLEEVRDKLSIRGQHFAGLQVIPIDKIVGSVGRYQEFNREFLPTQDYLRERWKQVYEAAQGQVGFPPIDVYRVGDVYFVRDGHHRVSVLRELGATTVEATVTELETPVHLSTKTDEADLALKAEYASFLAETHLDKLRPDQKIEFTVHGQYLKLWEHIAMHRYYLGLQHKRDIAYAEAVAKWYDEVYMPLVQVIRSTQILASFPGRTEADLYLWIIEHRYYLSQQSHGEVPLEQAAADFSREFTSGPGRKHLEDLSKLAGEQKETKTRRRKA